MMYETGRFRTDKVHHRLGQKTILVKNISNPVVLFNFKVLKTYLWLKNVLSIHLVQFGYSPNTREYIMCVLSDDKRKKTVRMLVTYNKEHI